MSRRTFQDRETAGRALAERLSGLDPAGCVVLGLPRGGVPVAAEVAARLHVPLDVLIVRKLGAPLQPELAIGAVVDGDPPDVLLNEDIVGDLGLSDADVAAEVARQSAEIERRRRLYRPDRPHASVDGRTAIVVDDGAATGATLRVALKGLRRRVPRWLVAAVPVASESAFELLRREADDVVCLDVPKSFGAVGYYYSDFSEVSDEDVVAALVGAGAGLGAR